MTDRRSFKARLFALLGLVAVVGLSVVGLAYADVLGRPNEVASAELLKPAGGESFGTSRGELAPDFVVSDLDGNRQRLSDYRGKVVVLNFWATWCLFCAFEMPELMQFQQAHPEEVVVVAINRGEPVGRARSYLEQITLPDGSPGVPFELHGSDPDDSLYSAYRAIGMPSSYFINPDGKIAHIANGPVTLEQMEEALSTSRKGDKYMPFKDGGYDDTEFWARVNSEESTFLAFWNHTCAPCKVMAPTFERLAKRYRGRMEFIAVSVYDREDIARRFGVSSTPTFILTRRGKALRHAYGVIHEARLAELIEPYALPAPPSEPRTERRGLLGWFKR